MCATPYGDIMLHYPSKTGDAILIPQFFEEAKRRRPCNVPFSVISRLSFPV